MRSSKFGVAMVVVACGMAASVAMAQHPSPRPKAKLEQFRGELLPATADYMVYRGVRYPLIASPIDDSGIIYNNTTGPNYVLNPTTPDWRNSILEDFSFSPGPASGGGALITSINIAIGIEVAPPGGFDLAFEFYDTLTPANTPVNTGPNANGFFFHLTTGAGNWAYTLPIGALPGGGVTIPDDSANGVAVNAFQSGTTTPQTGIRYFYAMGAASPGTGPTVGGSNPGTWSDIDQDGAFASTEGVIVGTFTSGSNLYLQLTGSYTPVAQGACCLVGSCTANQTSSQCTALGGVWLGAATACGTCPAPGACCISAGVCSITLEALCTGQNGTFSGVGSTCPPASPCNPQYFVDDGSGELNVGFQSPAASIAMVNQFTVANNLTTINSIDVAFGDFTAGSLNGLPVDIYLWSDPNQDGDPTDAVVLTTVSGVVASSGTGTFVNFPITPTVVGPNGTKFFVGLILTTQSTPGGSFYPGLEDSGHIQNKSWFLGNTTGTAILPNALAGIAVQTGNWLVRADATAGAASCYANCDHSTTIPCLNVLDFGCFLNKFAAGDSYANCDNSTTVPILNVLDFGCFLNKFAAGCSSC